MDISIPYHLAAATAESIDDFPVIVGPPVWTGFTHYNMGGYGTITVRLETFIAVVSDICRSIKANGFDRIIMMNGHGGNVAPVTAIANKLAQEDIMTLSFPYWNLVDQEMNLKTAVSPSHRRADRCFQ
jgi:creatinine amidohydrolase